MTPSGLVPVAAPLSPLFASFAVVLLQAVRTIEASETIETSAHVKAIVHEGEVRGVLLDNECKIHASTIVIAAGPNAASALVRDASPSLRAFGAKARPVHAACLDLALDHLPNPDVLFTLGFDSPLYFSVHSASARLAPHGCALVHVAKYLSPNADPLFGENVTCRTRRYPFRDR